MTLETRDKTTEKIQLVGQKIETLFVNWGAKRNLAACKPHVLDTIDAFYQPYICRYMRKRNILQQYIE